VRGLADPRVRPEDDDGDKILPSRMLNLMRMGSEPGHDGERDGVTTPRPVTLALTGTRHDARSKSQANTAPAGTDRGSGAPKTASVTGSATTSVSNATSPRLTLVGP
jgi:hypothetical protein